MIYNKWINLSLDSKVSVSFQVSVQVATLRKPGITDVTMIGLFSRVCSKVLGQSGAVCKGFAAQGALVGSLSIVGPQVSSD